VAREAAQHTGDGARARVDVHPPQFGLISVRFARRRKGQQHLAHDGD